MKNLKCTVCLLLTILILAGCKTNNSVVSSFETAGTSSEISSASSTPVSSRNGTSSKTATKSTSSSKKSSGAIDITDPAVGSKPTATSQYNPGSIYPKSVTYSPIPSNQYVYYSGLSLSMQSAYKVLCDNIESMATGLIPLGKFTKSEVSLLFTAVKSDHPEYFWLPNSYVVSSSNGNVSIGFDYKSATVSVSYLVTPSKRTSMSKEIQEKIIEVQTLIKQHEKSWKSGEKNYSLELLIHDWLLNQVIYDTTAAKNPDGYPDAFTVYGALVKGRAVCEGYSRAMQLLLNFFGINSNLVTGDSQNAGHMWNIVNINGRWYHLDATWNDISNNSIGYTHGYFNVTDTVIKRDHTIDPDYSKQGDDNANLDSYNFNLPSCNVDRYSYHRVNDTMIDNFSDIELILTEGIWNAAKNNLTRQEFAVSDSCTVYYTNGDQLVAGTKLNTIISEVNQRLASTGKMITLKNVVVNKNGSFVIFWTIK